MKGFGKLLIASSVLALAIPASTAPPGKTTVTVVIHRVKQVDNLDKFEAMGADRADFYATVWIDGKRFQSKVVSEDDARPEAWRWTVDTSKTLVPVRIKLADDDGGLEEKDDFVDISPRRNDKDLNFVLNTRTGRITGEITARRGQNVVSKGKGDNDKGQIWFSVH